MSLQTNHNMRRLPSVDKVLHTETAEALVVAFGRPVVTYAVRRVLERLRSELAKNQYADLSSDAVARSAREIIETVCRPSLKPVINATGIVLHTNLGRAPLGEAVVKEIQPVISGYCNLEFDLDQASRGHRMNHLSELLSYLTGAQGIVVVNNNAAGIILALNSFARDREVIISRGELIEIGGAFRIPEIMAASGAVMVEVGTTNRTRVSDYEQAITPETALIFKAHKSNYTIEGFTEEVSVRELSSLAHIHKLPMFYDIGSGLLRKPGFQGFMDEPDVQGALKDGADLVMFSGDKLLGGPQAGIIAGRKDLTDTLSKAPLMRALRVGKFTIAALGAACRNYLNDELLERNNPVFSLLRRSDAIRKELASTLQAGLTESGLEVQIVESTGQCGGGTLPELKIPSFAVSLVPPSSNVKIRENYAETVFHKLLKRERPVLAVLREGHLLLDTFALSQTDLPEVIEAVRECAVAKS